jgi:hypothetical protein
MNFLDRLRSLAQARLGELTSARESDPRDLSEVDEEDLVREIVPRKQLKANLRDDWQHASEEYASSHQGSQLDEELITAYVEGAVRDFVLDVAVRISVLVFTSRVSSPGSHQDLDHSTKNRYRRATSRRNTVSIAKCMTRWTRASV